MHREGHSKECLICVQKRMWRLTALALGRLTLYLARAGILCSEGNCPWCKYSDLSGGLMGQRDQSPVLEQSLARTQDALKKPQWRLSPEHQGPRTFRCWEQFYLRELALPSWLGSFLKTGKQRKFQPFYGIQNPHKLYTWFRRRVQKSERDFSWRQASPKLSVT